MAFSAPRSEAELMLHLPPSNRPGVFPRDLLAPSERVVYETRPSFFRLYWGRTIASVLLALLFVAPMGQPGYATNPAAYFLIGLCLLPLALAYLAWGRTAYAITGSRVLASGGLTRGRLRDAFLDQVTHLSVTPGYSGGLRFDTEGSISASGVPPSRSTRTIRWYGLEDAPRVYGFVQQAFAVHARPPTAPYPGVAPVASPPPAIHAPPPVPSPASPTWGGTLISCRRCGTVIDSSRLVAYAPTCPNCGSPLPRTGSR